MSELLHLVGPRARTAFWSSLVCTGALLVTGCAGGGGEDPVTTPETQPPAQVAPELEPPPGPLPPPIREVQPATREKVKVIDPGEPEDDGPTTLIEASRLAKQRKAERSQREPVVEINDDNLAEYAEGAEVIVLESEPAAPLTAPPADVAAAPEPTADDIRSEDFWRDRALELRLSWRRTIDEIADLQLESAALRQRYYAEESSSVRDGEVKPAWDRALDRLEAARTRARRTERELQSFLEDGRRAGALQGWLNQGWELEPTDDELRMVEGVGTAEPQEPVTRDPVRDPNS
ncbi:MAG: hypothetical protein AAGC60_03185 [Acidobacteriota bacterium]